MTKIFKKTYLLFFFLMFGTLASNAQLLDSLALDSAKTFYNLEKALKTPNEVYKLKLTKEKLKEFPTDILKLKNLNELNISKNKFRQIPNEIGQLEFLQVVNISKNKLDSFPVGLCNSVHIKDLNLSQNRILAIPKEIGQLTKLEMLDMWSNDIGHYPEELNLLVSLKEFDLRVIQINDKEQEWISNLLPNTKIHFSNSCNCF